jgi:hypothetical protein
MIDPVPISPNTDQLRIQKRIDQRRQASIAIFAKQRASPKTYGQAITPKTVRMTPILPERISNDSYYTGSGGYGTLGKNLNDDNRVDKDDPRDNFAPHRSTMMTASEANNDAIHELLMDIDIDSDEGQVDTKWLLKSTITKKSCIFS